MCWCTPEIRAPMCGKLECKPPREVESQRVLWKGTLAYPGRSARKFNAQIIKDVDGGIFLVEKSGIDQKTISPASVDPLSLFETLVILVDREKV